MSFGRPNEGNAASRNAIHIGWRPSLTSAIQKVIGEGGRRYCFFFLKSPLRHAFTNFDQASGSMRLTERMNPALYKRVL